MPLPGGSTTSCSGNDMIEFDPNGTFTATFSGSSVKGSGTWRLTGNNLALTFTAPPNVAGRSQSATIRFGEGGNAIMERLANVHPIGRLGRDTDIANAVVFLASDKAAFMTGAELVVDGGMTAM